MHISLKSCVLTKVRRNLKSGKKISQNLKHNFAKENDAVGKHKVPLLWNFTRIIRESCQLLISYLPAFLFALYFNIRATDIFGLKRPILSVIIRS